MLGNITLGLQTAKYSPWAKTILPPVFINKVLLEQSHTHSFIYCLLLLSQCNSKIEFCIWPTKPKVFPHWPFRGAVCSPLPQTGMRGKVVAMDKTYCIVPQTATQHMLKTDKQKKAEPFI